MYKGDLALNDLQRLNCHKTKLTAGISYLLLFFHLFPESLNCDLYSISMHQRYLQCW